MNNNTEDPTAESPLSGGRVSQVVSRQETSREEQVPPILSPVTQKQLAHASVQLAHQGARCESAEEFLNESLDILEALYPHRIISLTLKPPGAKASHLPMASGNDELLSLRISREACVLHGLDLGEVVAQGFLITAHFTPHYDEHHAGFDVPLVGAARVLGVLGVEYDLGVTPLTEDQSGITQLILLVAAHLTNFGFRRQSLSSLDYFGELLDHANVPIVLIGPGQDIRVANQAFCDLFGVHLDQLVGGSIGSLLTVSERSRIQPVILQALAGQETRGVEITVEQPGHEEARLALNVAPLLAADHSVEGAIAIAQDLTELYELEAQVTQAEKLATLGQLAAGVVHELNNPLTSIAVYSEYLYRTWRDSALDARDLEKLHRIGESVDRIRRFTQDLVTYARPSNEAPRPLSAISIVERSLLYCEHLLTESGAEVQLNIGDDTPGIIGVADQLHQVFINLITNACHAMPEGAGRLQIGAEVTRVGLLAIHVQDNGAGVPPDLQTRIFEPFFTTKDGGRGSGLGLSIVRKILHHHGGDILLRSEIGQGTRFTVSVPTVNLASSPS
jgi:PAS domain S-box-containing protein